MLLFIGLPLLVRGVIIPRSVVVIDFLLFTMLLIGSRVSFAALNDTFIRLQSRRLPHVLIIGAGDLGELVLRSLIRSRTAAYRPVGFLDPDPGMNNRAMHGVRVLGTLDQLTRVASEYDVDVVVLALSPSHASLAQEARDRCAALNVPVYPAATFVEMHFAGVPASEPTPEPLG